MRWGGGRCAPYLTPKFSGQPLEIPARVNFPRSDQTSF